MKINSLIIVLLLLSISVYSQTKIDDYVAVEIPGTVQKFDTTTAGVSALSYYSNSKAESYFVMRIEEGANGKENRLPGDQKALKNIYHQVINNQVNSMGKKGFILLDTQEVKVKRYSAYQITYRTSDSKTESAETLLLSLNGAIYVFTYSRVGDYVVRHKDDFLNSLNINSLAKQTADVSTDPESESSIVDFVTYGIIALVVIAFFVKQSRDKSSLGINLNRIYCPNCQTKQPFIRKPANQRQALYGGCTCRNCKTEMDKYGVAITSKMDDYAE